MHTGSINGARGSLRTKLLRGLFGPMNSFLTSGCGCKEKSHFAYSTALKNAGIWPTGDQYKKSVQDVLNSPGFTNFQCEIPDDACFRCRLMLQKDLVVKVGDEVLRNFQGLCLDCMKLTKSEDVHRDYWLHDQQKKWDQGCRITHAQPTWYFSYMGRKTDMKNYQQRQSNH